MTDTFTKEVRSKIMAKVKSENTVPEIMLRKQLYSKGVRYRINYRSLEGNPDVVIPSKKIAIFIDGCFWHKCPKCFGLPDSNKEYWRKKIEKNVERDKKANKALKLKGWRVIRIWEHEIRKDLERSVKRIVDVL